jgi:hypothetical protein
MSTTSADGSTVVQNSDGSTTTSWPDGTSLVQYPDGSSTTTWSNGYCLNTYPDGSSTLNDGNGTPLDPGTGQPLAQSGAGGQGGSATPAQQPSAVDTAQEILSGAGRIEKLAEAAAYLAGDAGETLLGAIEPVGAILDVIEMIWETLKAMATEERGCRKRAWCYTVLYGALDLGAPPEPSFQGSLQGPDQDRLDQEAWNEGVSDGQQDLSNGASGVALRNKLLLRVAHDGDPSTTLNALWQVACQKDDDTQLAQAYPSLNWPQPTGA